MVQFFLVLYNLLLITFLIPILLVILLSGKRNRSEFLYCIGERLSVYKNINLDKNKKTVWIHCASLGEARAVEPMLDKLQSYNIVLTSITKSAREYLIQLKKANFVALAPVDIYPFVLSAVSKIKPDILVLIETEIWPSLIYSVKKSGASVVTVNGRISKTAFKYYKMTSLFWKKFINLTDAVLVRNEIDFKYFKEILGSQEKLKITGNIKYDRNWQSGALTRAVLNYDEQDLIFVAGSTKAKEENILADVYLNLKNKYKNLKLIIAPRHITRIPEIENILKQKNIKYSLMSKGVNEAVTLVDVFGKLQGLYSVADVVFVGGSLINSGGQNPIEPSAYAKPVIFGKYMFNFESEAALLKQNNAAFEVSDAKELEETVDKLLSDKNFCEQAGKNALAVVEEQKGNIDRNINLIKQWI